MNRDTCCIAGTPFGFLPPATITTSLNISGEMASQMHSMGTNTLTAFRPELIAHEC